MAVHFRSFWRFTSFNWSIWIDNFGVLKTFYTPDETKYDTNVFWTDIRLDRIIFHLSFFVHVRILRIFQELEHLKLQYWDFLNFGTLEVVKYFSKIDSIWGLTLLAWQWHSKFENSWIFMITVLMRFGSGMKKKLPYLEYIQIISRSHLNGSTTYSGYIILYSQIKL